MKIEPVVSKTAWGQASVIMKREAVAGKEIEAGVFTCEPGKKLELHAHQGADEYCWVTEGTGIFEIADKSYEVSPGEVILIPKDVQHTSYPKGDKAFTSFYIVCS